ncbi:energy-coupled thiamine transporter ThiT [Rossellomorea vietnamensis]|uniref:energy-coupled thiamine transporter ThiT n=1 Tax=Rossellomorea vietnamensis TaxID=218284 RepID=UPI001E39012A|nr:energy-coupled thiamine transporter ThiT [Rossellomorea vietnamensis]MCC5803312.1 energy-coupled thiamine transporter ThiT [Rossellomorea vietnamensis]
MKNTRLVVLLEASLMAAFAIILDLLPSIKLSPSISISIAMVPIFLLSYRRGLRAGLIGGFLWGGLQIALGDAWIATPVQMVIEYFIAFAFIGFAGVFTGKIQGALGGGHRSKSIFWVVMATFAGSLARYFWHFIAGFVFFAEYAPDEMSPLLFSLIVNGITMLGSAVLCSVVMVIIVNIAPRLIKVQSHQQEISRKAS